MKENVLPFIIAFLWWINNKNKSYIGKLNFKPWFILSIIYMLYKRYQKQTKSKLFYSKTPMNEFIQQKIKTRDFKPNYLLQPALIQTSLSILVKKPESKMYYVKEPVVDPDNKIFGIKLSWGVLTNQKFNLNQFSKSESKQNLRKSMLKKSMRKISVQDIVYDDDLSVSEDDEIKIRKDILMLIMPGVTGVPEDQYIFNLCYLLLKKGYQPVVYNYRLISDENVLTDDPLDLVQDLDVTLTFLRTSYPRFKKIYAIGHSYGANQLVLYLGKAGQYSQINGAISVANPYCLLICSRSARQLWFGFYDYIFAQVLKNIMKKNIENFKLGEKLKQLMLEQAQNAKNMYEFDEAIMRRLYHYDTVDTYYRKFSSAQAIHEVKIPLFSLNSRDDPIAVEQALPIDEFLVNQNCMFMLTEKGGHVGWIEGFFKTRQWHLQPVFEYLEAVIEWQSKEDKEQQLL